jgi:hypothetical protein
MDGILRNGLFAVALGVGLVGCGYSEAMDGTPSNPPADPAAVAAANDQGVAPKTSALYEEVFEIEEGAGEGRRCRVRLNWCNRPGPDDRGECVSSGCDINRGFEACTTLAWEVCGTFLPPYIIWQ